MTEQQERDRSSCCGARGREAERAVCQELKGTSISTEAAQQARLLQGEGACLQQQFLQHPAYLTATEPCLLYATAPAVHCLPLERAPSAPRAAPPARSRTCASSSRSGSEHGQAGPRHGQSQKIRASQ